MRALLPLGTQSNRALTSFPRQDIPQPELKRQLRLENGGAVMNDGSAIILLTCGRILLGAPFVIGGLHHFSMLAPLTQALAARGLPAARLFLIAGSIFQTIAGLLLIIGYWVRLAALGLVVFTVIATVLMLNFWDLSGEARANVKNGFMANVSIVGGLLIAAVIAS
jgi:putative oxidoreductase